MIRESRSSYASFIVLSISSLCMLVLPSALRAQAVAVAQVSGNVTDPSGSAIVGAQVQMIETDKQAVHAAVSDANSPCLKALPYRNVWA